MPKFLLTATAMAVLLAGCQSGGGAGSLRSAPAYAPKDIIATVNGRPIPRSALEMPHQGEKPPEAKIVDDLISRELMRQYAEKQNLAADPKFAEKLDNLQRITLSQLAAEDYAQKIQISDEELRKEYQQRLAAMKVVEYKARHILVESEADAGNLIAKLKKGADFADLARKNSKDSGSKTNGGELGWFAPQQMVPEFAAAVEALKNGETTEAPVKTQFGWHVIQREDAREKQPPQFEQVKDQFRAMLQTRKVHQLLEDLKKEAKIERAASALASKPAAAPKP